MPIPRQPFTCPSLLWEQPFQDVVRHLWEEVLQLPQVLGLLRIDLQTDILSCEVGQACSLTHHASFDLLDQLVGQHLIDRGTGVLNLGVQHQACRVRQLEPVLLPHRFIAKGDQDVFLGQQSPRPGKKPQNC